MNKIKLRNYQGYSSADIDLYSNITTVIGPTDSGKSSIVRAVKLVRDNKPSGDSYIKKGTNKSSVTIDKVTHEKTKTQTKYYLEGKEEPFKALRGGGPPEEISEELNLGPENIQTQHEPMFLLDPIAYTPGKVAGKLSNLINLEPTTNALKFVTSKKRKHNADIDALNKSIEDSELQLALLKHVDAADSELAKLEAEKACIDDLQVKHADLLEVTKNAVQAKIELSELPSVNALEPAYQLVNSWEELCKLKERKESLSNSLDEIYSAEHILSFKPDKLITKAKRIQGLKSKHTKLLEVIFNIKRNVEELDSIKCEEQKLVEKKQEMLGGQCPLCGRYDA